MIWVLVAIMSVSLIVMAITAKDKVREICLKVFCIAVTIFLIVGTAEVFYDDVFKVTVASRDRVFEIKEFERSVNLDETVYIITIEDSNVKHIISDGINTVETDYQGKPVKLTVTINKIFDYCTLKTEEKKIYKIDG